MFGRKKRQQQHEVPDTSVRVHESGYIMRRGEHMVLAQEVTSPEGSGWLLVTNMEFFFIHYTRGIYLHLEHDIIESVKHDKDKLTIKWMENGKAYDFQMRLKEGFHTAKEIIKMLDTQFQYARQVFEHIRLNDNDVERARHIRVLHFESELAKTQETIRKIEAGETENDGIRGWKSLEAAEKHNLECARTMPFVRSTKVPAHIQLTHVWNDCYYDEKRKIFVTFRRFPNGVGPETHANQGKLGYEGEGIAFGWKDVDFEHGYPVLVGKTKDGHSCYSLLCTLTEEMITDELVISLFKIHHDLGRKDLSPVFYETEAPRWIGGRFFKITDAERRIGLRYMPWLQATNNPDVPWIKPMESVQLEERVVESQSGA